MDYKLGYHILVLPNQVLFINSVLTNEVLLYIVHTWQAPLFFAAIDLVQLQLAPRFCRLFLDNLVVCGTFSVLKTRHSGRTCTPEA